MIPWHLDDGFTGVVKSAQGLVLTRPMLAEHRRQMFEDTEYYHNLIFRPPWYYGPPIEKISPEEREIITRQILLHEEASDWQDVKDSILLIHEHAGLVQLSCEDCRTYATDHSTGVILRTPDGLPQRRPLPPPCETAKGCPKGHYSNPREPSRRGILVWRHYWFMRAARRNLTCPLMTRNAAYVEWTISSGRRAELNPFSCSGSARPARDTD